MKICRLFPLCCLLAALSSGAAAVDQRQLTLGAQGELYAVETGPANQIFPGALHTDNPVMALSLIHPDAPAERVLVPGTEGPEVESSPSLLYEETSGTAYLIWESRTSYIHSQIKLASFAGGEWTAPIELPGEFFSLKTSPSLAITRDSFITFDAAGEPEVHPRTIYHAIWWEEAAEGERVVYSPVVLVDGVYIGWNPLFVLTDLGFDSGVEPGYPATPELLRSPTIAAGKGSEAVVVGLVDPASAQLVELEISVVAGELGGLADQLAAAILDGGAAGDLADRARAHLIDFGARLRMHPGLIDALANEASAEVGLAAASSTLGGLVDRARAHLIDFGARMAAQGLTGSADERGAWLLEFPSNAPLVKGQWQAGTEPLHALRVTLTAARPIPRTSQGQTTLYVSRSGAEALVAWEVGNTLFYIESLGETWSDTHRLSLGPHLDLARVHSILEQRIRNR